MINFGLTGLITYLAADDAKKRKVLQDYKYPNGSRRDYYRTATEGIRRLHQGRWSRGDARREADALDARARAAPSNGARTALRHNARVIREYVDTIEGPIAPLVAQPRGLCLVHGQVRVTAAPTFVVRYRNANRFVRLHLNTEPLSDLQFRALAQCVFEAARAGGIELRSSAVVVHDVHGGTVHAGARQGARMATLVRAALVNIETLWTTIEAPRRWACPSLAHAAVAQC